MIYFKLSIFYLGDDNMETTTGKATTKAKNKYNAKTYDNLRIVVKKGNKSIIEEAAKKEGKSLNSYVLEAVNKQLIATGNESILNSHEEDTQNL